MGKRMSRLRDKAFDFGTTQDFASETLTLVMGTQFGQFDEKKVKDVNSFHNAILDLFNSVNKALPGTHYDPPPFDEKLKDLFQRWTKADEKGRRKIFSDFMKENVKPNKVDETLVLTGIVVPPGAMVAKRTGQVLPQLSFMKSIPDVIFVPIATIVALAVLKLSQIKKMRNVAV